MSKWTKTLKIQILVSCMLTIIFMYAYPNSFKNPGIKVLNDYNGIIIFLSLSISYVLLLNINKNKYIKCSSRIFNVLFLPYDFAEIYLIVFQLLFQYYPNFNLLIGVIRIIGFTLIFIPVTVVSFSKIKTRLFRLASIEIIIYNYLIFINYPIDKNNVLIDSIEKSGLVFAATFIVFLYWLLKAWGLKFRINLKQKWTARSLIISVFLVIFLIWYDFFASFIQIAPDLSSVIWNWNLSILNPTHSLFFYSNSALVYLTAINGGVLEELERYIFIIILGLTLKTKKMRIELIVLASSLIFSLNHYVNILTEQKSIIDATFQVADVFSFGCLLAIIFLYIGKLWLAMIIHTIWDFIVFAMTPDVLGMGSFLYAYDNSTGFW